MMYREVVFACALLLGAVYGEDETVANLAALVNCSSPYSIVPFMQKCLDLYNLNITLPDPALFGNASTVSETVLSMARQQDTNTTARLCRPENIENNIKGSICVNYISKKCSEGNPVRLAMLPSNSEVRQQIILGCQQMGEYNRECVLAKLEEIKDCANVSGIVTGLTGKNSTLTDTTEFISRLTCASYALSRVCGRKHLKSCGERTVQIYVQNLPNLEVCKNYTDLNTGTDGDMTVDCSSDVGVQKSYLTCQINARLFFALPVMDTSDELSEHILKTVTLDDSKEMCKKPSQASELINCTLSVQRECSPDSLKSTVPDIQSVQHGFQELCTKINDFDAECVSSAIETACKDRKRRSVSNINILKHLCEDTSDHNKCLVDSVKTCGDVASSQYADILSAQLPQMCLGSTPTQSTSSAMKATLSAFVFFISVITLL